MPIGIIHSSVGGTQAESWLSREAQAASPLLKDYAEQQIDAMARFDEHSKVFQKALPLWEAKYGAGDPGNAGLAKGWANENFDDSGWQTCLAPVWWRQLGLKGGCIIWLRKTVDIPADKAGKGSTFGFTGYGEDVTPYFNGQELKPCWPKPPRFFHWWAYYSVPGSLVKAGRNVIALRIHSLTENGLMWRTPKTDSGNRQPGHHGRHMALLPGSPLPGPDPRGSRIVPKAPEAQMNNTASALFNGKIYPLIPYALRGVIWYQGESNANRGNR